MDFSGFLRVWRLEIGSTEPFWQVLVLFSFQNALKRSSKIWNFQFCRAMIGVVKVDFTNIRLTLKEYISELRRSSIKVSPEMNESGPGLSNATLYIRNGCLTKKLQLFKDDNKTENAPLSAVISSSKAHPKARFVWKFKKFCFDCFEKLRRS